MSKQALIQISGSCHCGNLRFALLWPAADSKIAVRECGCTFCKKHAGAWTSHRSSELTVDIIDESIVSRYKFGTKTADFYICSACGIVPFVLSEIDKQTYAVVNVNTFHDGDSISFSSSTTNFDGEDTANRLERRKRNWIPSVIINTLGSAISNSNVGVE